MPEGIGSGKQHPRRGNGGFSAKRNGASSSPLPLWERVARSLTPATYSPAHDQQQPDAIVFPLVATAISDKLDPASIQGQSIQE
jgi:hypothetical protein